MIKFDRRFLVGSLLGVALLPGCAGRLTPTGSPRIGFLAGAHNPQMVDAFLGELARLGWVQGRTIHVETRVARPNSSDARLYSNELARSGVQLIVASALPYALEVRRANPGMPMVVGTAAGLVSNGFARSMARPGGIVTGMEELVPGLTARRLAYLKQAAPHLRRIALLSTTPGVGGHEIQLADAEAAAPGLGVSVKAYRATNRKEIERALGQVVGDGMQGLVNFQGGLSLANRQLIVDFAAKHRLPAIYQAVLFAEAGGLMSWAPDQNEQLRVAARLTDRILRGAKPGDLPITYPSPYFLTINRSAARRIGLNLPEALLRSADRVIE